MSGVDVGVAMAGMKKAMKNAASDGKSLDQALADFSKTMDSNASETDKLNTAYDLFGSKAGAAIYNAMETGKLSFDGFSSSMKDFSGNVDSTFKQTLDPIDQFKMTMNSLQITGAEVGNSIATVLAPSLKQLSDWLKGAADSWDNLSPGMQDFIIKAGLIAAAVGPVLGVSGMTHIQPAADAGHG